VAGGAGAGAEALPRRGGIQGAAADLHLPSMPIASRDPDRDLKLWSGIPKIITTQNLSICNCKHDWNVGRVECLFNFVSNLQCTDFDIAL